MTAPGRSPSIAAEVFDEVIRASSARRCEPGSPDLTPAGAAVALAAQPANKAIYRFLPAQALPEVGAVQVRGEVPHGAQKQGGALLGRGYVGGLL